MPEDGYISMRDYALQMRMVKFLHETYPEGAHYAACGGVGVRNGAAGRIVLPISGLLLRREQSALGMVWT